MRALQITQSSQHTGGWGSRIAVEIKASLGLQVSSRAAWTAYRMRPYKKREEKEKEKQWLDMTRHGGGEEGKDRRGNGEKKMRVKQKYKNIHHHWAGRQNTPHPHSRSWQALRSPAPSSMFQVCPTSSSKLHFSPTIPVPSPYAHHKQNCLPPEHAQRRILASTNSLQLCVHMNGTHWPSDYLRQSPPPIL